MKKKEGTLEELKKLATDNLKFEFYKKTSGIEDTWFNLYEDYLSKLDRVQELVDILAEKFQKDIVDFDREIAEDEQHLVALERELYNLVGSAHIDTNVFGIEEDSMLFDIKEKMDKLKEKVSWLGDFEYKEYFNNTELSDNQESIIIQKVRNSEVRSIEDSIADLAKMNSLLFSCISAMYGTMSDSAKGKIDESTKTIIDYSVEKFDSIETRADRQLIKEGTGLVDKLFDREVQIADIIDSVKS